MADKSDMLPAVDMANLTADEAITVVMQERFAMPPVVIAALRQGAKRAVLKLLQKIESDDFDQLPFAEQKYVIDTLMDRAYGKAETASSSMNLIQRAGGLNPQTNHGKQLKEIEDRMEERGTVYPELRRQRLTKRVTRARKEKSDAEVVSIADRINLAS